MGLVSQTLRDSAKGRECTLRFPGVCNRDPATTVLAHLPSDVKGMGNKGDDFHAVFACSACHEILDLQKWTANTAAYQMRALQRTQKYWFEHGLLQIAVDKAMHVKRTSSKTLPPKPLFGGKK